MADAVRNSVTDMLKPLLPIPTAVSPQGRLPNHPKAILFDIYGTLLISGTGDISLAEIPDRSGTPPGLTDDAAEKIPELMKEFVVTENEEARKNGIDFPEVEIRKIWRHILIALQGRELLKETISDTSMEELAIYYELSVNPVWPMPGFPEIVKKLSSSGQEIGIVSNAQFYTPLIIEALVSESLGSMGFRSDICAWSYELRQAKPSPRVFEGPLSVLSESGITAQETVYVGNDMLNDITAASGNGCMTVLFAGDHRSLRMRDGDKRVQGQPDAIITDLEQLTALISGGSLNGQT